MESKGYERNVLHHSRKQLKESRWKVVLMLCKVCVVQRMSRLSHRYDKVDAAYIPLGPVCSPPCFGSQHHLYVQSTYAPDMIAAHSLVGEVSSAASFRPPSSHSLLPSDASSLLQTQVRHRICFIPACRLTIRPHRLPL